jgi:hypothetical protein
MSAPLAVARAAARLFDAATAQFALHHLDFAAFRHKALEIARGNPGQIVETCRLASDPEYHAGRHIKFSPLRLDPS